MPKSESATTTKPDAPKRDRHGQNRGLPPPATFDFEGLPDGSLLSEIEVAAILRVSSNTLGGWRRQGGHPLKWRALPNGFIRYTAGHVREFLASGKPRPPRGRPPAPEPKPPTRKPKPGTPTTTTEIHAPAAVPERRRVPRRLRAAAAPQEASS